MLVSPGFHTGLGLGVMGFHLTQARKVYAADIYSAGMAIAPLLYHDLCCYGRLRGQGLLVGEYDHFC